MADHTAGVFHVNATHEHVPFTAEATDAVRAEMVNLADRLGLEATSA